MYKNLNTLAYNRTSTQLLNHECCMLKYKSKITSLGFTNSFTIFVDSKWKSDVFNMYITSMDYEQGNNNWQCRSDYNGK